MFSKYKKSPAPATPEQQADTKPVVDLPVPKPNGAVTRKAAPSAGAPAQVTPMDKERKRKEREKEELRKYGSDKIVADLLPAVDNLERALEHAVTAVPSAVALLSTPRTDTTEDQRALAEEILADTRARAVEANGFSQRTCRLWLATARTWEA